MNLEGYIFHDDLIIVVITSIKLESYQIPRFYSLLEEYGVNSLPPRNNFEAYFGELDGSHISIQINGQVSHDNNRRLQELVDIVFGELDEEIEVKTEEPQHSAYMILAKPAKPQVSTYQINHLNIWMNPAQFQCALDLFQDEREILQVKANEKFERYRFTKNNQHISFHDNGKVIAEQGYSVFAPYLAEAIESYLPFKEFDLIIGQDEVGNGEKIGPLVVGAVGGTPKQMVDMQLIGVKDSKMVPRGITLPMAKWVKDIATMSLVSKIDPREFNQIRLEKHLSVPDILTSSHKKTIERVKQRCKELNEHYDKIVYVIDQFDRYQQFEQLQDDPHFDVEVKYVPHGEQKSIAVAAASLIAKASRLRWMKLHEKVHQISLKRRNLSIIRQHRRASYLLKNI